MRKRCPRCSARKRVADVRLPSGIRRLFRLGLVRPQVRRDLDDELGFHFEEAIRDLMSRGLTTTQAREKVTARFGDERAYRHTLERIDDGRVRMGERSELMDSIARTLVFAFRGVRRAPGFTASVVVILALGIGANAVMFGVVDRLLLSPPQHVVDAHEVRLLHVRREVFNGETRVGQTIAYPDYRDFFSVDAFAGVAAYTHTLEMTVGRAEAASQAPVVRASASLFPLLGAQNPRRRPREGRYTRLAAGRCVFMRIELALNDVMFVGILGEIAVPPIDDDGHDSRPLLHVLGHLDRRTNVGAR